MVATSIEGACWRQGGLRKGPNFQSMTADVREGRRPMRLLGSAVELRADVVRAYGHRWPASGRIYPLSTIPAEPTKPLPQVRHQLTGHRQAG